MGKKRNIMMSGETIEETPKTEAISSNISPITPSTRISPKKGKKQVKTRGKAYSQMLKKVDRTKTYPIAEAVKIIRDATFSKKNTTVEVHLNLGLDITKAEHKVRTMVSYPHGTGKEVKILIIGANDIAKVEQIIAGKLVPGRNFDMVVAHPSVMKELAKVAKILGPKGLMPNPKSGTVSEDPKKTAEDLQKGATEIKTEKSAPVIHTVIGKLSFDDQKLMENFEALILKVKEVRPSKVRGVYIKSIYLASSMSPSVKISL
ncbi:50S ribosomal protein L1 [candidate division WWE3 bacterium CG08_land_8_20_14_0_20_40_13]|uniref:Ribosomal protein n=1 Tax=candidate division WWE3 bacterium CG08_land_8_20_14_0_20_40_13 TaxID=1975084 RepID=A0A2H0XDH1_UNCKA|nr:MAG: 50S ribosomal protein L1 [candidate division WWE3 bacterium CG08_land_8_20_14_0_20_40_13]